MPDVRDGIPRASRPFESPMTLAIRNSRSTHVHVYSVFGNFCYLCMHRKRWWRLRENWTHEDHDEPF